MWILNITEQFSTLAIKVQKIYEKSKRECNLIMSEQMIS